MVSLGERGFPVPDTEVLSWQPHDQAGTPGILGHQAAEAQQDGTVDSASNSVPVVTRIPGVLSLRLQSVEQVDWLPKIHAYPSVYRGDYLLMYLCKR